MSTIESEVILARIGWMDFYRNEDRPIGGGSYNKDNTGHERFNFLPYKGNLYGYVRCGGQGSHNRLNTRRLNFENHKEHKDNVTVIWVAPHPEEDGSRVVGWYKNATAYSDFRQMPDDREATYCFKAKSSNCVLPPTNLRNEKVPTNEKGGFGQSNIRYTRLTNGKLENREWISRIIDYIENYKGPSISSDEFAGIEHDLINLAESRGNKTNGQGYCHSVEQRIAIETRAMDVAKETLKKRRWNLVDENAYKTESYDLLFEHNGRKIYVEVKGTSGSGNTIFITEKERQFARKHKNDYALFIVRDIQLENANGKPKASGGKITEYFQPKLSDHALKAVAHKMTLNQAKHRKIIPKATS